MQPNQAFIYFIITPIEYTITQQLLLISASNLLVAIDSLKIVDTATASWLTNIHSSASDLVGNLLTA